MTNQTRSRNWVAILIFCTAFLLSQVPVLLAFLTEPSGWVFGGFLYNPYDGNSYLAKMYAGWSGAWRYSFPYTAQTTQGGYLFLFYLFLGHFARWFNLNLLVVYQAARVAGTFLMLAMLYFFWSRILVDRRAAKAAFLLSALGSGMGWLAIPLGEVTTDISVPEAYPFLSAYTTPHFSLGLALLLLLLIFIYKPIFRKRWVTAGAAFLTAFLLSSMSPFGVVIAIVVGGLYLCWESLLTISQSEKYNTGRGKVWFTWLKSCLNSHSLVAWSGTLVGGMPLLLYYAWIPSTDPVLAGWNAQNLTPGPEWWDLLLSFSPAILLALAGLGSLRQEEPGKRLLLIWLFTSLIFIFLPFGLQRRFLIGFYVPVAGLAGLTLSKLSDRFQNGWRWLAGLTVLLTMPSILVVLMTGMIAVQNREGKFYLTTEEEQAITWLVENTPPGSVVLSNPDIGLFIPAYTGRRVVYGHPFETVNAVEEESAVQRFFDTRGDAEKIQAACRWLKSKGIDFVFFTPRGQDTLPDGCYPEEPVYRNTQVAIFKMEP